MPSVAMHAQGIVGSKQCLSLMSDSALAFPWIIHETQSAHFRISRGLISDVPDRQREEAVKRIQCTLKQVAQTINLDSVSGFKPPMNVTGEGAQNNQTNDDEVNIRSEVQVLMGRLQRLADEPDSCTRNVAALGVLDRLAVLPVDVNCLRVTKIAKEVGKSCWRSTNSSLPVREMATHLFSKWRVEYRQVGGLAEKLKSVSLELTRRGLPKVPAPGPVRNFTPQVARYVLLLT